MKEIAEGLARPGYHALAMGLVHFLWQGSFIALLLALANLFLRGARAQARYLAACLALAAMLCAPAVTMWRLARWPEVERVDAAPTAPRERDRFRASIAASEESALSPIEPWIVLVWATGVCAFSAYVLGGWMAAGRLKRRRTRAVSADRAARFARLAERLLVRQPVRLFESAAIEVPTAIGVLRPVVLLPASILTGLPAAQLDSLLLHELAHIRRHDCLVNLVQAFAEALLFYHPAVWWVSHRIRLERENACDDMAVAVTDDPAGHARALLELEDRRAPVARLSVAAGGGRLSSRVSRLLTAGSQRSEVSLPGLVGGLALAGAVALGAGAGAGTIDRLNGKPAGAKASSIDTVTPRETAATPHSSVAKTPVKRRRTAARPNASDVAAGDPNRAKGLLRPDQLIAFQIHGVTPEFVGSIAEAGYEHASPDELLALRIHGVTPESIAEMNGVFGRLPLETHVAFKIHGVTPQSAKALRETLGTLSPEEALALRIHGASPDFVRAIRARGFSNLSAGEAVAFRIHGVTPEFVQEVQELGYPKITAEELIAFRIHGVTPERIRTANGRQGETLSSVELLERRIRGKEEER